MKKGILLIIILLFFIGIRSKESKALKYQFIQKASDRKEIKKMLTKMKGKVTIFLFTKKNECQYCDLTKQIIREVKSLNSKIRYKFYDIKKNKSIARKYGIKLAPGIIMLDGKKRDYGVRFFGVPAGYEFYSFLEAIKLISTGNNDISSINKKKIKRIKKKIRIEVFVTPTCPYCPRAVVTAHKIAALNKNITGSMIEAQEFYDLAMKNNVSGVPKIVVRSSKKKIEFVGALPEDQFVEKVLSVLE